MTKSKETVGASRSAAAAMMTSLTDGLNDLSLILQRLESLASRCGIAKGAVGISPKKLPAKLDDLKPDQQAYLAEWYRLRKVLGLEVLPRAKVVSASLLAAAYAIDDGVKETDDVEPEFLAAQAAVLASTQSIFDKGKIDKAFARAQETANDEPGTNKLGAEALRRQLDIIGQRDPAAVLSPRLMPILTVLPLDRQFIPCPESAGPAIKALTDKCVELVESVTDLEDDLSDLIDLRRKDGAITFTRKTLRRSPADLDAARFPELHFRVQEWVRNSDELLKELEGLIAAALTEFDKAAVDRMMISAHNLLGAQVLFNQLCCLKDTGALNTVTSKDQLKEFAGNVRKSFTAWRQDREVKQPRPQSGTVRLMLEDGTDREVDPRKIESIVLTTKGTWVYVIGDGTEDWLNFKTLTRFDVFRKPFLKSGVFVDVRLNSRFAKADPSAADEKRALINVTQIDSLQLFDGSSAWVTFKQEGEFDDVLLDETQLADIVTRAGLLFTNKKAPDDIGDGYRLFTAPGSKEGKSE